MATHLGRVGFSMPQCRNNCSPELTWDDSMRSASGKMIPLDAETGEPHQCPNSTWSSQGSGGSRSNKGGSNMFDEFAFQRMEEKVDEMGKVQLKMLAVMTRIQLLVEKQSTLDGAKEED